mgnify:CR=1 FL=1
MIDYDKYRWTQINALYIKSWELARDFLKQIRSLNNYNAFDRIINNKKFVKYLYYPPPFKHDDQLTNVGSQIEGKGQGVIIDYVQTFDPVLERRKLLIKKRLHNQKG